MSWRSAGGGLKLWPLPAFGEFVTGVGRVVGDQVEDLPQGLSGGSPGTTVEELCRVGLGGDGLDNPLFDGDTFLFRKARDARLEVSWQLHGFDQMSHAITSSRNWRGRRILTPNRSRTNSKSRTL